MEKKIGSKQNTAKVLCLLSFEILFGIFWNLVWMCILYYNAHDKTYHEEKKCWGILWFFVIVSLLYFIFAILYILIVAKLIAANANNEIGALVTTPKLRTLINILYIVMTIVFLLIIGINWISDEGNEQEKVCANAHYMVSIYYYISLNVAWVLILIYIIAWILGISKDDVRNDDYIFLGHSKEKPYGVLAI